MKKSTKIVKKKATKKVTPTDKFKINSTWSDDHLPCVEFELNSKTYDLCWTGHGLLGKLELVESGDITLETALKNDKDLLSALRGTLEVEETNEDTGEQIWYVDSGCLTLYVEGKKS